MYLNDQQMVIRKCLLIIRHREMGPGSIYDFSSQLSKHYGVLWQSNSTRVT